MSVPDVPARLRETADRWQREASDLRAVEHEEPTDLAYARGLATGRASSAEELRNLTREIESGRASSWCQRHNVQIEVLASGYRWCPVGRHGVPLQSGGVR